MNKLFTKIAALALGATMAVGVGAAVVSKGSKQANADEEVAYSLTPSDTKNNSYASSGNATIDGVTWTVEGNGTTNPWRLGGKSLSKVNRRVYSAGVVSDSNITKVELTIGSASSITVNSLDLIVSTAAGGESGVVSTVSKAFAASSTITFDRPSGDDWTGRYFTFKFNVTVLDSKNKFVEFSKADFYKNGGTSFSVTTSTEGLTLSTNSVTATGGNITLTTSSLKKGSNVQVVGNATSSVQGNVVSLSNVSGNISIDCSIVDANITDFVISGQKTSFTLNDSWSFGGTVTATYDDWVSPHSEVALTSDEYSIDHDNFVAGTEGIYEISVTVGSITKTYDVEVSDTKYYSPVASVDDLVDGAEVILVTNTTTSSVSKRYAMTRAISSYLNGFEEVTVSNDGVLKNTTTSAYAYTLEKNGDNWDFYNENTASYLVSEANKKMSEAASPTSHWSISISDGIATITSTKAETVGKIMFNWNNGSARFTTYTSSQSASMLLPTIYQFDSGSSGETFDVIDSVENGTLNADSVKEGRNLSVSIIPDEKYSIPTSLISVTMSGESVTYTYNNGVVGVQNVTGDIEITASCVKTHGKWADDPFTVSESFDAIDAASQKTITDAFVAGKISRVSSFSSGTITYFISDDGEASDELQVYQGKGLDNTGFSSIDDIEVGAEVTITGTLKIYNSNYEFDKNNYLVSYKAPAHTTPTITLSANTARLGMGGNSVVIDVTVESFEGDTCTLSVDGATPTTVNVSIVNTTITLSAKAIGTETITIKGVNGLQSDSKPLKVVVTAHSGTKNDPYTIADAVSVIDALEGASDVYLSGIVTQNDGLSSSGSMTYWINDTNTTTGQFEVYNGKGINGSNFDSVSDVATGDNVVVFGSIKKYNSTYEFNSGSILLTAKDFSRVLLSQTDDVCYGYDGTTNNKAALTPIWSTLGGDNYWKALPTNQQAIFTNANANYDNSSSNNVENAAGRYNMLCKKYFSDDNFANRDVSDAPVVPVLASINIFSAIDSDNTAITAIVVIISVVSLTAIGGYFFLRKRREQ